jgi:hypothetical protein
MAHYTANWGRAGQPSTANVSFEARSDYEAKEKANRVARELGLRISPRTIMKSGGGLIECINTAISE